jgi:hypothetical protein
MSATAAARGLSGIAFTGAVFRPAQGGEHALPQYGSNYRVQSIANVLRRSGYTIAQLSRLTSQRYGCRSPYFIPPTFLYKLRSGVTPHICQIVALSQSTGYRFVDWMLTFGFDLHQIPRLQVQLHPDSTVLVTPIEFETTSFQARFLRSPSTAIREGLGGLSLRSRLRDNLRSEDGRYCFAKIGRHDALISRKLFPGMIVRVDRRYRQPMDGDGRSSLPSLLWLLEQPGGLTCSQLRWIGDDQVVLLPSRPPLGSLPLCLSREARVIGLVNLEPGSARPETSQFGPGPRQIENPLSSPFGRVETSFSRSLRSARGRTRLTFRAAHRLTAAIARILSNPDYVIGLGLLSDYEATDRLPRHIAKIISLCIVYCLDIRQLLATAGVYIDDSNKMSLRVADSLVSFGPDFPDSVEPYRTIALGASSVPANGDQIERISRI